MSQIFTQTFSKKIPYPALRKITHEVEKQLLSCKKYFWKKKAIKTTIQNKSDQKVVPQTSAAPKIPNKNLTVYKSSQNQNTNTVSCTQQSTSDSSAVQNIRPSTHPVPKIPPGTAPTRKKTNQSPAEHMKRPRSPPNEHPSNQQWTISWHEDQHPRPPTHQDPVSRKPSTILGQIRREEAS